MIKLILSAIFFTGFYYQSIYSLSVKSIDGRAIRMGDFRNRKMLFVFIPVAMNDSTTSMEQLASVQHKYDSSVAVIGIPVSDADKAQEERFRSAYHDFRDHFILTEIMTQQSISSEKQDPLIAWLTHKEKNQHFDYRGNGGGQKFFVDEHGELFALLGPEIKLSSTKLDELLSKRRTNK